MYVLGKTGQKFVFEMQHQPITEQEIARRTQEYFKHGAAVTWLPLIDLSKLDGKKKTATGSVIERYSPKPFEKWLHGFNYKELWFVEPATGHLWQGAFDQVMLEKESAEWYESGGVYQSVSGYRPQESTARWSE